MPSTVHSDELAEARRLLEGLKSTAAQLARRLERADSLELHGYDSSLPAFGELANALAGVTIDGPAARPAVILPRFGSAYTVDEGGYLTQYPLMADGRPDWSTACDVDFVNGVDEDDAAHLRLVAATLEALVAAENMR